MGFNGSYATTLMVIRFWVEFVATIGTVEESLVEEFEAILRSRKKEEERIMIRSSSLEFKL